MPRGFWLIVVFLIGVAGAAWYFWDDLRPQLASGPEITPIQTVVNAPARYEGKQVTVKGTVTSTSDIRLSGGAAFRFYTLKEGAAEIIVVPQDSLPARGQTYAVTGKAGRALPGQGPPGPRLAETKRERAAAR